jgi:TM2 domain-containing membrane protein YozV
LAAVTVNNVLLMAWVGVPLITQVVGWMLRPAGKVGETVQPVILPTRLLIVGVMVID